MPETPGELPYRRLDDVRIIDPTDDHYGKRGCIGAVDHDFAPGRPYCVNFESTSRWYRPDEIMREFNLDAVRAGLNRAAEMIDGLADSDAVRAMDQLRFVLAGLVDEVGKLQKLDRSAQ
jgi:hypothetical protein